MTVDNKVRARRAKLTGLVIGVIAIALFVLAFYTRAGLQT